MTVSSLHLMGSLAFVPPANPFADSLNCCAVVAAV